MQHVIFQVLDQSDDGVKRAVKFPVIRHSNRYDTGYATPIRLTQNPQNEHKF